MRTPAPLHRRGGATPPATQGTEALHFWAPRRVGRPLADQLTLATATERWMPSRPAGGVLRTCRFVISQVRLMAADFTSIPIVDIAGLASPDLAERRAAAERIGAAARDVGFLYVTGHGVPEALSAGLREAAMRF